MLFFTEINTSVSKYCLLNIKSYTSPLKDSKQIIFIDPSVMELRTRSEYSRIDLLHTLAERTNERANEYLSIDYPCDMIPVSLPKEEYQSKCQSFIEKSVKNNFKYANNPHYICAVQSGFQDYPDFEYRMKELEPIYDNKPKIVAIGNLCRIKRPTSFYTKVIQYLLRNKTKFHWIHIYGMALACIKHYIPLFQLYAPHIRVSVDSCKWTFPVNNKIHNKYTRSPKQTQLSPTKHTQQWSLNIQHIKPEVGNEYFLEYMHEIQKRGIRVDY